MNMEDGKNNPKLEISKKLDKAKNFIETHKDLVENEETMEKKLKEYGEEKLSKFKDEAKNIISEIEKYKNNEALSERDSEIIEKYIVQINEIIKKFNLALGVSEDGTRKVNLNEIGEKKDSNSKEKINKKSFKKLFKNVGEKSVSKLMGVYDSGFEGNRSAAIGALYNLYRKMSKDQQRELLSAIQNEKNKGSNNEKSREINENINNGQKDEVSEVEEHKKEEGKDNQREKIDFAKFKNILKDISKEKLIDLYTSYHVHRTGYVDVDSNIIQGSRQDLIKSLFIIYEHHCLTKKDQDDFWERLKSISSVEDIEINENINNGQKDEVPEITKEDDRKEKEEGITEINENIDDSQIENYDKDVISFVVRIMADPNGEIKSEEDKQFYEAHKTEVTTVINKLQAKVDSFITRRIVNHGEIKSKEDKQFYENYKEVIDAAIEINKSEINKLEIKDEISEVEERNKKEEKEGKNEEGKKIKKNLFSKIVSLTASIFSRSGKEKKEKNQTTNKEVDNNSDTADSRIKNKKFFISEERANVINAQVYRSLSSIFAVKAITDWIGAGIGWGAGKLAKTKIGKKMGLDKVAQIGQRTDVYKYFEQKKETHKDRQEMNSNFTELLKIIRKKHELYNTDLDYNKKFGELSSKIDSELKEVEIKFTSKIKNIQEKIGREEEKIENLKNRLSKLQTDESKRDKSKEIDEIKINIDNVNKELDNFKQQLEKLTEDRNSYVSENIKPLVSERKALKEERTKKIESASKDEINDLQQAISSKINLYQDMIDTGRSAEFYDLPLDKREAIGEKIKNGSLSPEEKKRYLLSEEDKQSLKLNLGKILVENIKKKEINEKEMNKEIDGVTKDYVIAKVKGTTLVKDALNTAIVAGFGVAGLAYRGAIYGILSTEERRQTKVMEYNKKYKGQHIFNKKFDFVDKANFLAKDMFFNSTLEWYNGLFGKQLNIDYYRGANGKTQKKKNVEQLKGLAGFSRRAKSIGELVRIFGIGGQALSSVASHGANIEGLVTAFHNTFSGDAPQVLKHMGVNIFSNAENVVRIDRKINKLGKTWRGLKNLAHKSIHSIGTKFNSTKDEFENSNFFRGIKNKAKAEGFLFSKPDLNTTTKVDTTGVTTHSGAYETATADSSEVAQHDSTHVNVKPDLDTTAKVDTTEADHVNHNTHNVAEAGGATGPNPLNNSQVTEDLIGKHSDKVGALLGKVSSEKQDSLYRALDNGHSAIIKPGQGVSQALGKIHDSDLQATVVNPDGSIIKGDLNLAHTGDTVVQGTDGEVYILKTSQVKVSNHDTLVGAWKKTIKHDIGRPATSQEIHKYSGSDGKLQWNEAQKLHDDLVFDKKVDEYLKTNASKYYPKYQGEKAKISEVWSKFENKNSGDKIVINDKYTVILKEEEHGLHAYYKGKLVDSNDIEAMATGKYEDQAVSGNTSVKVDNNITIESKDSGVDNSNNLSEAIWAVNDRSGKSAVEALVKASSDTVVRLNKPIGLKMGGGKRIKADSFKFIETDNNGLKHYACFDSNNTNSIRHEVVLKFDKDNIGDISKVEVKAIQNISDSKSAVEGGSNGQENSQHDDGLSTKTVASNTFDELDNTLDPRTILYDPKMNPSQKIQALNNMFDNKNETIKYNDLSISKDGDRIYYIQGNNKTELTEDNLNEVILARGSAIEKVSKNIIKNVKETEMTSDFREMNDSTEAVKKFFNSKLPYEKKIQDLNSAFGGANTLKYNQDTFIKTDGHIYYKIGNQQIEVTNDNYNKILDLKHRTNQRILKAVGSKE